jgi:hypothetical protein
MLHKLRRAMVRPGRERLQGIVEVDETYWGDEEAGVKGRRTQDRVLIIVAAEENRKGIGRIRLRCIPDLTRVCLHGFIGIGHSASGRAASPAHRGHPQPTGQRTEAR